MITGPAGAIRHMRANFKDKSGPAYWRAVDVCYAALRLETDTDISRIFFLAAYEDEIAKSRVGH